MNKTRILVASLFAVAMSAGAASADDYKLGALEIGHPWSRALPKGATVAAGYVKIKNTGTELDRLVGGSTPVAGRFEIHEMSMDKGVMKMRPVPEGVEIKPGETVELKPGSFHIMLVGLKRPVTTGQSIKGTLVFEKAGPVEIVYNVEENAGAAVSGVMQHKHH